MTGKSQSVATGAFVVGALLIAISALIYLLGSGFKQTDKTSMVFNGAAKGLNVGAPVALRGVKIGQVTDVDVVIDTQTADVLVVVEVEIDDSSIRYRGDPDTLTTEDLIESGLRAQLNMLSLVTGLLYIEIDYHPNSEILIADIDTPHTQFPTVPTNLERLIEVIQRFDIEGLAEKLEKVGEKIQGMIDSEVFQELPGNINTALVSLRELSDQLQEQLASSGPRVDTMLDQASTTIANADRELSDAIAAFQQSMQNLGDLTSDDSATIHQLNTALQEVGRASRSLRQLTTTLENQPEALLQGKAGDQR